MFPPGAPGLGQGACGTASQPLAFMRSRGQHDESDRVHTRTRLGRPMAKGRKHLTIPTPSIRTSPVSHSPGWGPQRNHVRRIKNTIYMVLPWEPTRHVEWPSVPEGKETLRRRGDSENAIPNLCSRG